MLNLLLYISLFLPAVMQKPFNVPTQVFFRLAMHTRAFSSIVFVAVDRSGRGRQKAKWAEDISTFAGNSRSPVAQGGVIEDLYR